MIDIIAFVITILSFVIMMFLEWPNLVSRVDSIKRNRWERPKILKKECFGGFFGYTTDPNTGIFSKVKDFFLNIRVAYNNKVNNAKIYDKSIGKVLVALFLTSALSFVLSLYCLVYVDYTFKELACIYVTAFNFVVTFRLIRIKPWSWLIKFSMLIIVLFIALKLMTIS